MNDMKIIASLVIAALSASTLADEITRSSGGVRVRAELASDERTIGSASIEMVDQQQDWSLSNPDTSTVSRILEEDDFEVRFIDCNENGISDDLDLSDGADDANGNGVLDDCEYAYGDLNLDGEIDGADIFIVLGWFAAPFPIFGDLNGDGTTNAADMGILLSRWGSTPF
jgi:hypothetical protein